MSETIQMTRKPTGNPKTAEAMVWVPNQDTSVEAAADHVIGGDSQTSDHAPTGAGALARFHQMPMTSAGKNDAAARLNAQATNSTMIATRKVAT